MPLSFKKNLRFSPKPETRLDEFEFVGGLMTDPHETKLEPNQSPSMENVVFNDTGSIKTRNGYTRYNNNPVGASSSVANTGTSTGSLAIEAVSDYVAQTFQPGTISVAQVDLYLEMETSGEEQYVRVELWSTSGGPTSILTSVAKSQILLVSGDTETAYNFRFKEPISLTTGTTYALVVKPFVRGTSQSVNQVNVHYTGNDYANGTVYTSTDTGTNWTADAAKDLKFVVYAGGDTGGTGLIRFYGVSGIQQLITKLGTTLYRGDDGTGAMTAITLGSGVSLAATTYLDWTVTNGTLLLVDGSNRIQKYRGSTNANYSTGTLSVTNGSAVVTGSGTAWNTVTNAVAGEYIKLPDGKWYKINSIASNTQLTIEVEYQGVTDSGEAYVISPWGEVQGRLETSTTTGGLIRPTPSYIENHINRIWVLEGNTLRFSALDTSIDEEHFNNWDSSNNAGTIIIPSNKGDTGTGLYSMNGYLYVFQRNAIWEVFGTSPASFELRNISNEVGMLNRRTLVEYESFIMFLGTNGIYVFDGANLKNFSDGAVNQLIDSWASKSSAVATIWDNKYLISYSASGTSANSEALFYDMTRKVWGRFTNVYSAAWSVWNGGTDTDSIYFVSSNQGSIYSWDVGGNDDGYEITTTYDTPSLGFGANTNDKVAKKLYLQQIAQGEYNMTVTVFSNITESETTSDINLSSGTGALWGVAEWDVDSWSSEATVLTNRVAEFQGIAKFFKLRLSQTGYNEGIEALGVTVTVRQRRLT